MVSLKYLMDKRSRSSVPQFRCRVPAKVVDRLRGMKVLLHLSSQLGPAYIKVVTIGTDVAFSLGESDERIAKARHVDALEHLQRLFEMTAAGPVSLSHKDMVALSGEAYRLYQEVHENDPGEPDVWAYHKAFHRAAIEGRIPSTPPTTLRVNEAALAKELFGTGNLAKAVNALPPGQYNVLEGRFGLLADYVLIRHRIHLAPEDRERFLRLVGTASLDAGWQLKRNAEGDYSPDPKAIRFPPVETVAAAKRKQTITGLFDHWWKEAKATGRTQSTHDTYRGAIDRLVKHLDHDDASRISEADMLAFKDARLKVVTAKTFKDGDLPGIKSVFGWAVDNRKLTKNPANAVKIKSSKRIVTRQKGFTDQESSDVFRVCLSYVRKPKEFLRTAATKRWTPLIAAYTGCRINEALQLRKEDVRENSLRHIFDLNPLAGGIKTGIFRLVPIHQHLIELGLLEFVEESDDGPLFAEGCYTQVVALVRTVVTDERVQPNHAWRHRFKTISRDLGFDPRVVDAIQGHAARTSGDDYGDVSVMAMTRVIDSIPKVVDLSDRKPLSSSTAHQ